MSTPIAASPAPIARPSSVATGIALAIAVVFAAGAARAEMLCGERDEIVSELKKTWQEDRTAIGLANNGGVIEVFSSEEGTWTLLMTSPDGETCLISAGEHWEQTQMALLGDPA